MNMILYVYTAADYYDFNTFHNNHKLPICGDILGLDLIIPLNKFDFDVTLKGYYVPRLNPMY